MEDNNATVQQDDTQADDVQDTPEQEVAEATEQPEESTEQEQPAQEPSQTQDDSAYDLARYLEPQQNAQPKFTPDDDGFIDPEQFYNRVLSDAEARLEQKMQFQENERKAWQSIETKYPEIQQDAELREIVNAQRIADVARGGKGNLDEVAGRVLGKIKSYQSIGKAQAQVSEKVQKSAGLQQNNLNSKDTSDDSDLMERMSRGDEAAKEQLISSWLKEGKL
jgi:hypothetical protein